MSLAELCCACGIAEAEIESWIFRRNARTERRAFLARMALPARRPARGCRGAADARPGDQSGRGRARADPAGRNRSADVGRLAWRSGFSYAARQC